MGSVRWPANIRPLTSKNYSFARGSNISQTAVGGMPRTGLNLTIEPVQFSLNFSLTAFQYQIVTQFYDSKINHGVNSFVLALDAGYGLEDMQCTIVKNTWKPAVPHNGHWYLAFSVYAESTESQLEDCGNMFDLYECYGDDLPTVLKNTTEIVDLLPSA